tara:strand:- start:825 stop:1148 length:324 start_codon:yes stop_codon:yes gene_type:complete
MKYNSKPRKTFDIGNFQKDKPKWKDRKPRYEKLPGMAVAVQDNNVEKAIRRLKKMLTKEGMFQELRDRRYYVKPSEKKRVAKKAAIRRARRERKLEELGIPPKRKKH